MYHHTFMGLGGSTLRLAIGITAGLCYVAFGMGQGDIGAIMIETSFRSAFPTMDVSDGSLHKATIAGITGAVVVTWTLGCMTGAFLNIFIANALGRKNAILLGISLEIIGRIIQTSAFTFGQYVAGRFIAGLGNGFIASTVPAWQAECLKSHRRGSLLMVSFGACITGGLAIAYWICYAFHFVEPNSAAWRVPIAFSLVFLLPALVMAIFMPESPRWLILAGREEEAYKVLSALSGLPTEDENIRREFLMIRNAVVRMAAGGTFSQVFSNGRERFLHRTLLAVILQVAQQFTGVNLFMQYLAAMFSVQLNYPISESLLLAACCASAFFLASFVTVIGIDHFWGRRSLTMFGSSGMCLCMILLAIFCYIGNQQGYYVMTAFLFLYVVFFSIGWQGMSWLWAVELIPLTIRGPANAMATAANWLSNVIVVICTPVLFNNITYKTYVLFAVTNFATIPLIYLFYPETGGRSLEEVDLLFEHADQAGKAWLSVVGVAKKEARWYDKDGEITEAYSGSDTSNHWRSSVEKKSTDRSTSSGHSAGVV